ncbi:MAG: steroid 3-ketoacyl-CoA thiolase [Ilumatobacteraceae bacterium]|jgi:acetyl-CoA C-acetyltransferase|nr:steroid 3-ketoacyl-CoA thiolase [Ilumatobacteraceae bacterium]
MARNQNSVVIVDAVRTPIGRRNGGLSTIHPGELLGIAQQGIINRTGIDPSLVEQVVGGCVSQVGEQSFNVTRTAWLAAGLPLTTAATTVDTQCGSSQQATGLASSLIGSGVVDIAIACGVEVMSRVPIGSNSRKDLGLGVPIPKNYFEQYEMTSQFEGAERIADKWKISRDDTDRFGLASQERAIRAWAEDRFAGQYIEVDAPEVNEAGEVVGTRRVAKDEGLRETTLEKLSTLKPVARENGVHTAGNSSQISDGAAAVLMMTEEKASQLGMRARARIVDTCLVGVDPVLMLTGPIDATQRLLERNNLKIDDIDVFEINEAFASVVLAWAKELGADIEKTNPNGGAIALGHPLGATGAFLVTKALNELERTGGRYGIISMCCGGGLGTGTLIERL